jgi:hypothetical protein
VNELSELFPRANIGGRFRRCRCCRGGHSAESFSRGGSGSPWLFPPAFDGGLAGIGLRERAASKIGCAAEHCIQLVQPEQPFEFRG